MYFIRYSEHSEGNVFIGENDGGSVIKIEFRDTKFMKKVFLAEEALHTPKLFMRMRNKKAIHS